MSNFSLDILGNEWIIIIFVSLVLLLGTKKLPEASRKLANVMAQYNKTKNIVQDEFQKAKGDFSIPVQGPVMSERQKLETMAKSLGIDSTEKSDNELRDLINSRIDGSGSTKHGLDTSSNL